MTANEVIESYVSDVAVQLPRKQRNDVAFELRALLGDELHARAEAAGRDADAGMAIELLRAFGRPADVAARYRPALTIIDPADGYRFLRATVVGLTVIWSLGLLLDLLRPIHSASDVLVAVGHWWSATVIPSLWWPGVLVVGFGTGAWVRRRWPQTSEWTPRTGDRGSWARAGLVLGLVYMVCGLALAIEPRWVLDVLFRGRAAVAAYDALTYTDAFRRHQGPCLLALILLYMTVFITVIVKGRWTVGTRRVQLGLSLAMCAVLAWTVLDGPVFMATSGDRVVKPLLVLIVAITLIDIGIKLHRSVRPAPSAEIQAQ